MLANHTSITSLLQRTLDQFERLIRRQAFLDQYKKQPMFEENLEEFDDAREVLKSVVQEYKSLEPEAEDIM
jgi:tubulin gamma